MGALPPQRIQETSLRCSCHPAAFGAVPGPPCAQTLSHLLQSNIPPPRPGFPGYLAGMCCQAVCWEEARPSCLRGDPPCTKTPPLNRRVLQSWGQLGVTPCHPDILP